MMHNKFGLAKPQSKDKGEVMIKPPKFKARKPHVMTQLAEPPAITFEMLRSHGILQPKNDGIPNPLHKDFDLNKHCAFHFGMQDRDTNECRHLKEEIQKLISSGRISQRSLPQLVWYQPPKIIPTQNYTPTYHPPFTMRPPVQTMWYPPPTIALTSRYIPTPYPQFVTVTYPHNQATMPRATKK
ncbi:hypothetical protein HAX54_033475 [Datura stramonium]|uniref:Uncharacterized protein n=1 Tax=Datura stramonium TaxID=4076 RepID=A0ABS8SDB6_DATST|nr:hypothetical protein [Datura stramonium]